MMQTTAGLYIHVPFCPSKCEYCDFYSVTQLELVESYVEALLTEMELRAPRVNHLSFRTVYIGGGTPSLLTESQLERIREALFRHFHILPDSEFTIEANPGTLSPNKLIFFRNSGINRLSMGVQSFHHRELAFLGRIHTVTEVIENFYHAREAGFSNINIDLMTAFPGISETSFRKSLQEAIKLAPEHISCYTLIFEPGTVFYKRMQKGEMEPLSDDEEAGYYALASETLGVYGYLQYEISNFARGEEFVCQHNLIYWNYQPYLGLGPSAHSFFMTRREANKRSVVGYIKDVTAGKLPVDFAEELTPEQQMFEYLFLRLRLRDGIDMNAFEQRFGVSFLDKYNEPLHRLMSENLVEQEGQYLRLSEKGWMVADFVSTYF